MHSRSAKEHRRVELLSGFDPSASTIHRKNQNDYREHDTNVTCLEAGAGEAIHGLSDIVNRPERNDCLSAAFTLNFSRLYGQVPLKLQMLAQQEMQAWIAKCFMQCSKRPEIKELDRNLKD
jgi:hypothetical protein